MKRRTRNPKAEKYYLDKLQEQLNSGRIHFIDGEKIAQCTDFDSYGSDYYWPYYAVSNKGRVWDIPFGKWSLPYYSTKSAHIHCRPGSYEGIIVRDLVANYFCDKSIVNVLGEENCKVMRIYDPKFERDRYRQINRTARSKFEYSMKLDCASNLIYKERDGKINKTLSQWANAFGVPERVLREYVVRYHIDEEDGGYSFSKSRRRHIYDSFSKNRYVSDSLINPYVVTQTDSLTKVTSSFPSLKKSETENNSVGLDGHLVMTASSDDYTTRLQIESSQLANVIKNSQATVDQARSIISQVYKLEDQGEISEVTSKKSFRKVPINRLLKKSK